MYKTVRHGENSLQYTILPQQDESTGNVNHKTSSGLCRGRSHRTKRGRTTTILIVTLILVCSIVAGSILVPLLMTTDMVAFRKLTSSQASASSTPHVVVHRHHAAKVVYVPTTSTTTTTTTTTTSTTTSTSTVATTPEDNFNTLTTGTNQGDLSNSSLKVLMDDLVTDAESTTPKTDAESTEVVAAATAKATTSTSTASPQKPKKSSSSSNETVEEVPGGENNATVTMLRPLGTTRIVVEATVAGGADRNWTDGPEVVIAKVARPTSDPYRGWLPPRWPFADPSSYLQWTGYGSENDSLLLPLLLGLVIIVLVLILVFCYVMKRKHQKYLRREAIGKMSSDLQCDEAGDKSTLLQETNSEEE